MLCPVLPTPPDGVSGLDLFASSGVYLLEVTVFRGQGPVAEHDVAPILSVKAGLLHRPVRRGQHRSPGVPWDVDAAVGCGFPGDRMHPAAVQGGEGHGAVRFQGPGQGLRGLL